MSRDVARKRLRVSLLAAVLLSAAAHAAVVFMIDAREPVGASVGSSAPAPSRTRVSLAPPAATRPAPPMTTDVVPLPRPASVAPIRTATAAAAPRSSADRVVATSETTDTATDDRVDRRPQPLTYPVISLPSDDDPRRVGLVRLMLIVSSEGRVVKTVVTAATLSQDYVDRITESFEAVRFEPATVHGLPHASWYEVVVDFTFDPGAGPAA